MRLCKSQETILKGAEGNERWGQVRLKAAPRVISEVSTKEMSFVLSLGGTPTMVKWEEELLRKGCVFRQLVSHSFALMKTLYDRLRRADSLSVCAIK